jgi:hypothetical protein
MGDDPGWDTKQRLSVAQAADALSLTVDAIRSRIARDTIEHVRESGRVYVLLNSDEYRQGRDQYTDKGSDQLSDLTDELRDRLHYVEGQLDAERQAHAEARRIIAGLVDRMPALDAPTSGPGSPVRDQGEGDRGDAPQQPEAASSRPWWRRILGG